MNVPFDYYYYNVLSLLSHSYQQCYAAAAFDCLQLLKSCDSLRTFHWLTSGGPLKIDLICSDIMSCTYRRVTAATLH